jgi:glycosyltransferase involved in cell wall biosynthesis
MRIVLSANAPWSGTGYGTQGKGLAIALRDMGHDVAIHAWYGLQGGMITADGFVIYPRLVDPYGGDTGIVARHFGANIVITIHDIWVMPPNFAETLPCPWVAWFPVDGDPLPPVIADRARKATYPVTYCEFGKRTVEAAGIDNTCIPMAIDTSMFRPGDKSAVRAANGLSDDTFLVTMVAANKGYPSRKSFPEALQAFKMFHETRSDSVLYLHTEQFPRGDGLNLPDLIRLVGIPETAIRFVDQDDYLLGLPDSYLAEIYQMSDVLLAPSMGEGFGLPIAEAQACGCPVITTDCTSMSELTINGIAVPPIQKAYYLFGQWQYVADVGAVADALTQIADRPEDIRESEAAWGVECFQAYSWEVIAERHWRPFLSRVEAQL